LKTLHDAGPSAKVMRSRCTHCFDCLSQGGDTKLTDLGPTTGTRILSRLSGKRSTVQAKYNAFKTMLSLAGVPTANWPKAPTPPRKQRERVQREWIEAMADWMEGKGLHDSAWLVLFLAETGMRIEKEALSDYHTDTEAWVWVEGKGGHERAIPLSPLARDLVMQGGSVKHVPYKTFWAQWDKGRKELYLPVWFTPHKLRHYFATEAYDRSGKNLKVVQTLLGHADITTTAIYLGVDREDLERAVAR